MLEALIGVLILGGLTVLVLNQQVTANRVQQTNQGRDRAEAVAQDILHQAQSAGCGTVVGTETADLLGQILGGCNWANINSGVLLGDQAQWSAPTAITDLCTLSKNRGSTARLAYLDSTPWFCQQQDNQWFTVQLRTDWAALDGTIPNDCKNAAAQPLQVVRTVDVIWVANDAMQHQSWTVLSPIPPGAVATQLPDGGGAEVSLPGSVAGPVRMKIPNSSDSLVVWAPHGTAWLPFLPIGFGSRSASVVSSPGGITNQSQQLPVIAPASVNPPVGQMECVAL